MRCSRLGWVECRRLEGSRYKWVSQISENRQARDTKPLSIKGKVVIKQSSLITVEVGIPTDLNG